MGAPESGRGADAGGRESDPARVASPAGAARERLVEALLHVAEDALFVWRPGGGIESWNQGAAVLYGYSTEAALGRNPHELLASDVGRPWSEIETTVRERGAWEGEIEQTTLDGRRLVVWARLRSFHGDDGAPRVLEANRDFTTRRHLERAVERERDRARELLNIAGVMIVAIDVAGKVILANRKACQILGRGEEAILGHDWFDLAVPADRRAQLRAVFRDLITDATGPWESYENPIVDHRGEERIIAWHNTVLRDEAGRVVATLSSGEDVTEQRRAEAALREVDRRKDEFLAMLSHELRKPLAPIRTALDVLAQTTPAGGAAAQAHAIIDRQVGHLARLVDDLLDVTRVTRGKIRIRPRRLELGDVVRTVLADQRPQLEAKGISVTLHSSGERCWVDADPTRLAQILDNLLDNAGKFTPAGGRVDVSLRPEGEVAQLEVRDTGVGLAPEVLADLFQPFTQAPQSLDRTHGGLGLGLTLVKGLVELHGGSVAVASDGAGRGTAFTLHLPLTTAPTPEPVAATSAVGSSRRVLVIEDHLDAADSLKLLLELCGHEVQLAPDGATGLAAIASFRPDVVLCDLGLPGLSGYDVARAVRADPQIRDTLLVALTGYAQPEDRQRAAAAGFDLHLAKPANLEVLSRVVGGERPAAEAGGGGDAPDAPDHLAGR